MFFSKLRDCLIYLPADRFPVAFLRFFNSEFRSALFHGSWFYELVMSPMSVESVYLKFFSNHHFYVSHVFSLQDLVPGL